VSGVIDNARAPLEIGVAKAELNVFEPGMWMLGWGNPKNAALGVGLPLWARAVVLRDPATDRKIAYLCADVCFITLLLRRRTIEALCALRLGLGEHNTLLTATHTHSGPNGFSGQLYHNISAPGFSDRVFRGLVQGFTAALHEADRRRAPGRVYYHRGDVPESATILFNRSVEAYNRNVDVAPLPRDRRDEAVDRTVRLLRFDDLTGRPVGALSWLGVHPTTIHYDNQRLHPDHKGLAAIELTRWAHERYGARDFVAIFAQGAGGDVTPNYRYHRRRGLMIGRHDDDLESAHYCGEAQARVARQVLERAPEDGTELHGPLDGRVRYVPLAERSVEARFTDGREAKTTTSARIGLAMALGTDEGPGPLFKLAWLSKLLRDKRARAGDDPKVPFVDLGVGRRGRLFDVLSVESPLLTSLPAPAMEHFRRLLRAGALGEAWVPSVLPIQVLRLGGLLVSGLPCEPTVVAGRRLQATVRAAAASPPLDVVVNGYANGYGSYLCTEEEYAEQHYEAACTLYGPWTLAAYRAELSSLVACLGDSPPSEDDLGLEPPAPDLTQLGVGRFAASRT
jgi:neutral ceramidase